MSDILTYEESNGLITSKTISWLGDGNNNMSNSLIEAAGKFNFNLKIACPKKYVPSKKVLTWAKKNKVKLIVTTKPDEAVKDSDCIMTDKWVSMNDNVNKKQKKKTLKAYQVNKKLMNKAKSDAIFMHCLPVGRGEEVTDEIIDGKKSVVWRQALNRVHTQKSIIKWCLD
jgi:ornithine carbamoyltransferase